MALSQQLSSNPPHTPIVLTVAGSDSGGGAGIQADIKAISATGSYACSVISALTAQNTLGVSAVLPIPADFIEQQFDAIFSDLAIDVVKIGMLGDANTIKTVAKALNKYQAKHIVLDPVMVATSGDLLLAESAISCLISQLIPLASVITPNIPEALALLGKSAAQAPTNDAQSLALCKELLALGCHSVLLKGGHQHGQNSTDYWLSHDSQQSFSSPRIDTKNTHGTGCSLSSAIASYLAQGHELATAIGLAKQYITSAIAAADALHIGKGCGPVDHFFAMRSKG
ncbi:bifunctional hydroxymethylpyrimidine kinase/phosphomethylpyrimidine kinase [Gammaproteobacteria bacterium AS21]|jgi:hydroxymethylpyrimidine/phosphomethylpyrimidine kinase